LHGRTARIRGRTYYYYIHSQDAPNRVHTNPDSHKIYRADKVDRRVWEWIEEESTDKDRLLAGAREYRTKQQAALEPITRELELAEALVREKTQALNDALEMMRLLTSPRAQAQKAADIAAIEGQIDSLEERRTVLADRLSGVEIMTDEQAITLAELTGQVVADLVTLKEAQADSPELALMVFEAKRQLIEKLDLKVTLFRENGKPQARITAKIAAKEVVLPVEYTSSAIRRHNRQTITITVTLEL
jgi:hypothetical protein